MKSSLQARKLRLACNSCHQAKTRCSGGMPCTTCQNSRYECIYSISNQLGRPKGTTKNRRENSAHASNNAPQQQRTPSHSSSTTTATTTPTAAANLTSASFFKDLSAFDSMLHDGSIESTPGMFFANGKGFPDPMGLDLISNFAFNPDRNDLSMKVNTITGPCSSWH